MMEIGPVTPCLLAVYYSATKCLCVLHSVPGSMQSLLNKGAKTETQAVRELVLFVSVVVAVFFTKLLWFKKH